MLICLKFSKPPDNITPQLLFGEVEKKVSKYGSLVFRFMESNLQMIYNKRRDKNDTTNSLIESFFRKISYNLERKKA